MSKLKLIEKGHWFYPVKDFVYDKEYFNKYKKYAKTDFGKSLLQSRLEIINQFKGKVLDIGVGACALINAYPNSMGYDVNPIAIQKLKREKRWFDPYNCPLEDLKQFNIISFFDSLEHMEKPEILLNRLTTQNLIIAIPIFKNKDHLIKSRHFRKDEHYHYFTCQGFIKYMKKLGFKLLGHFDNEIQVGREDIHTFTFIFERD